MPLPEIPAYSRGLLPFLRSRPAPGGAGALPFYNEYNSQYVGRGVLSGLPYIRPQAPRSLPLFEPVYRNNRWELLCPWPKCGWSDPSGVAVRAHWQSAHQSRNDRDVVLWNRFGLQPQLYRTKDWWEGGRITDLSGRRDARRLVLQKFQAERVKRAYELTVRGQECRPENSARFARPLCKDETSRSIARHLP